MEEVSFKGRRWIWANNRMEEGFIEERLDMFFGSKDWMLDFEKAEVKHILTQSSNHFMLLLDTNPHQPEMKSRFIFENRWSKMQGCSEMVQTMWNMKVSGSRMYQFHSKLKNVRTGLLEWRKKVSTNSKKHIDCLKK